VTEPRVTFAGLLRRLRTEARLTQEELAEASGVSLRSVSDLERGRVTVPQKDTIRLLADALRLIGPVRAEFVAVARGRAVPGGIAAATRTLPRDIGSFTGRHQELHELVNAAANAGGVGGIHAIGGMAGVGKTAFAVHAAYRLADRFPGGQIFLPLHGHTPGLQPVDPEDALASLLLTAGVAPSRIPPGVEARMALWRDRLAERQLLLILDDAVGSEQVLPLLPGSGGSVVLITSRRHLSALEGATAISLDTLPPDEAAGLLVQLAGRAGLSPGDAAVAKITRLCGYLPLAIGMMARQLRHHPAWSAIGRAAELAAARDRLGLMATENLSVAAAFDLSYVDLTADRQRLFRLLGLHPGTEFDGYAAAALGQTGLAAARRGLEDLYDQYLLIEQASGRYRMHDLIREHARGLAARDDSGRERDQATAPLLDYYQHVAARANALISRHTRPVAASADFPIPATVPALDGQEQALAWAQAERASLLACLDHAADTGQHGRVIALTAGIAALLQRDGPWADAITRHTAALAAALDLGDPLGQANALADLAEMRQLAGDYPDAAQALEEALGIYRDLGDRLGQANSLQYLGVVWRTTGDYPATVKALEQALGIYRDLGDRLGQANSLFHLGIVRRGMSDFPATSQALEQALDIYRDLGNRLGQANSRNELGIVLTLTCDYPAAAEQAEEALSIFRDLGYRLGQAISLNQLAAVLSVTGDYPAAARVLEEALEIFYDLSIPLGRANVLKDLGSVRYQMGDYPAAARSLEQALGIYGDTGLPLGQANTLSYLAPVWRATGDYPAAARALERALGIYRDLGDRDGESEALNETGTLHRVSGDITLARRCHQQALDLARAIATPGTEAHALAGLGRCALADGRAAQAETLLRQALEIFQRIGAAEARDLLAELDALAGQPPAP
jgi:tetratricopeptide (TPR) repeat protein/transcriptional regulator with XRE-family HTH domain